MGKNKAFGIDELKDGLIRDEKILEKIKGKEHQNFIKGFITDKHQDI